MLQDEEIAIKLRKTDAAATRNMLIIPQAIVANSGRKNFYPTPSSFSSPTFAPIGSIPSARANSAPAPTPATCDSQHGKGSQIEVPPFSSPPSFATGTSNQGTASAGHQPANSPQHTGLAGSQSRNSAQHTSRLTKSDLLNRQSDAVCSIAKNFQDSAQKQIALM